ncbi:MAG: metal ABC transporter solute-binding protein, Zn/Mn family [Candidatus Zixiibacteriota bacterium]
MLRKVYDSFNKSSGRRFSLAAMLAVLALAVISCQTRDTQPAKIVRGQLYVVATTGIIANVARVIAGERAVVDELMGPGVDPHLYKASQGDISRLSSADLILYNGLHLEGKMSEALGKMSSQRVTVAVSDDIPREFLRAPPEFNNQFDPHVWFDVSLWSLATEKIITALIQIDPKGEAEYRSRGAAYQDSLAALHTWVTNEILRIPEDHRALVTAHDAFGYFGRAYQIEVYGLQGISTASEYGLNDVTRLVDMLVERKIKAVFIESSVPPRAIEAVVTGCAARGHEIVIGGELFSDALGFRDTPEGSYLGMVRHNVNTIVEALR